MIESHRYNKLVRYSTLRWVLIREVNNLLNSKEFFYRVINVKKYTLMFLMTAIEVFD